MHGDGEAPQVLALGPSHVLAGCLRLADALDRSHRQIVQEVSVRRMRGTLRVRAEAVGDAELELWGVTRRTRLLESVLGCRVAVEVARTEAAPVGALAAG